MNTAQARREIDRLTRVISELDYRYYVLDRPTIARFERRIHKRAGELTLVCEPKYNGLSCSLLYEDGVLVRAATRGDRRESEDVTVNARTIGSIPLRLAGSKAPRLIEVRGEVMIPKRSSSG